MFEVLEPHPTDLRGPYWVLGLVVNAATCIQSKCFSSCTVSPVFEVDLVFGPHTQLCSEMILALRSTVTLGGLRQPYRVPEIGSRMAMFKAKALSTILSLQP